MQRNHPTQAQSALGELGTTSPDAAPHAEAGLRAPTSEPPAEDHPSLPPQGAEPIVSDREDSEPPVSGERGDPPAVELLPDELSLVVDGERVLLTRTQFSIFSYFFENAGRWVTPNELIRDVLGTHHQPDTSLVRVHVHAIRRRLGRCASWLESDPRRVRGYRWCGEGLEKSEVS